MNETQIQTPSTPWAALIALLVDDDEIAYLAREGFPLDVMPTRELRPVVEWALRHYRETNRAPSAWAMRERWGDVLSDHEVDLDGYPDETMFGVQEVLVANYARMRVSKFVRAFATEMAEADPEDRTDVIAKGVTDLAALSATLAPRTTQEDLRESAGDVLDWLLAAEEGRGEVRGMSLGLPEVDEHTSGVWPGELAVLAAGAGWGKSWMASIAALAEWRRGRRVVLVTLENSLEMTRHRLACLATHVDYQDLQRGTVTEAEKDALRRWVTELQESEVPLEVVSPKLAGRTPQSIVAMAQAHAADSLIIDQLTFMRPADEDSRKPQTYVVRQIIHDLKELISTGARPLPCLLMHQISREGIQSANRTQRLEMHHLADSAEVERTADHVFALYAPPPKRDVACLELQGLKGRRYQPRDWDLMWHPQVGRVSVRTPVPYQGVVPALERIGA